MSAKTIKYFVWVVLGLPFAMICWYFAGGTISYGQVIHQSGLWSAGMLIAALAITPVRRVFSNFRWSRYVVPYRRTFGVASFAYAALHTGVYLERKWGANLIVKEGLEAELATGWLAFVVFIALAVTSNDRSVRAMGRSWKKLHRWVYAATVLMFAHWWLATFQSTMAYVFGAVLVVTQLPRFYSRLRK